MDTSECRAKNGWHYRGAKRDPTQCVMLLTLVDGSCLEQSHFMIRSVSNVGLMMRLQPTLLQGIPSRLCWLLASCVVEASAIRPFDTNTCEQYLAPSSLSRISWPQRVLESFFLALRASCKFWRVSRRVGIRTNRLRSSFVNGSC